MRLEGKVALVTGAQQGIGKAIALRFAAEGAHVALNYLDDAAAAEAIAAQIRAGGQRCVLVRADVASAKDVLRLVETAERELGLVDVLVNNAGIFPRVPFLEITEEVWDSVHGVNLRGAFLCGQAVARRLVALGRPGAIINLASSAAFRGSDRGTHYVASKAGVLGLTRGMALELAQHRIRVNAIAPGLTDTAQPRYGMTEEELQDASRRVPLGRMAAPEEIAATAAFLASDDASQITGQVVHVNGGALFG
jgi:NAD(P)-dependent dehydrogenase (short-subunit alcohol dehydrogenase family)